MTQPEPFDAIKEAIREVIAKVLPSPEVDIEDVKEEVDSILVTIEDPTENNSSLMQSLLSQGIKIVEFAEEEATLEDLYLEVVKGGDAW